MKKSIIITFTIFVAIMAIGGGYMAIRKQNIQNVGGGDVAIESSVIVTQEPATTPEATPEATAIATTEPTPEVTPTATPNVTVEPVPETSPAATSTPTSEPTATPVVTEGPTATPTAKPTEAPTKEPVITAAPTEAPTTVPTAVPTEAPTPEPTEAPTQAPVVTTAPTAEPTEEPTPEPTAAPTPAPTEAPTPEPTAAPEPTPTPHVHDNTCELYQMQTCQTPMISRYYCRYSYCDHERFEEEWKEGDWHVYEYQITKEPTCTEMGIKDYKCTLCGHIWENSTPQNVSMIPHDYQNIHPIEAYDYFNNGNARAVYVGTEGTCSMCGKIAYVDYDFSHMEILVDGEWVLSDY